MSSGYFLGIFEGHADPDVAVVRDGEVIAYAEGERFIRQKHAWGVYPHQALQFCLDTAAIQISHVEAGGIHWAGDGYTDGRIGGFFQQINSDYEVDDAPRGWRRWVLARFTKVSVERWHDFEWRRVWG